MRRKLMIPGPVDIWDDALEVMGRPITPHYGDEWIGLYRETIQLLKTVFQTTNDIHILVSSGSGAMDACIGSLFMTGERVATVCNGPFINRTIEILDGYGIEPVRVESQWGRAADIEAMRRLLDSRADIHGIAVVANDTGVGVRNPVKELAQLAHEHNVPIFVDAISGLGGYSLPVDDWELDAVCASSNKCLEGPPGLGILSLSPRACKRIDTTRQNRNHGWYLNLSVWRDYVEDPAWADWHPYPITLATGLILALRASLKRIVEQETLEGHWARFTWAQQVVRTGLRAVGFRLVADDDAASPSVTSVWKRDDMEVPEFIQFMDHKHGYMVAAGTGSLSRNAFRISHMGKASTKEYLLPFLLGVEDFLRYKGADVSIGQSLVGLSADNSWY
jgi:alanine-glyoxylate transaminase/serine-glyoxylate transaminase/serine-pyruvate transaminase